MRTAAQYPPSERDLELLSAYLDGEMNGRDREIIEQRLTRETALRAALDDLRDTVGLVQSLPRLKAPRNFTLDPAVYGRKTPWWQRLLTFEGGLQLAGTLGTAASIAMIMLAVLFSQGRASKERQLAKDTQSGANEAVAITNAQPTSLATLLTAGPQTEIAFNGAEFQSTTAMQNAYFGGTETASALTLADTAAPAGTLGITSSPPPETSTTGQTPQPSAQPMMAAAVAPPAVSASAAGAGEEMPSTGAGEAPIPYNAAAPGAAGFAAPPSGEPFPGPYGDESGTIDGMGGADSAAMKQPTEAPAVVPEPVQSEGAFRELPTATIHAAAEIHENTPSQTEQETAPATLEVAADLSLSVTATPVEVAQAQVVIPTQIGKDSTERQTVGEKSKRNLWWLAGIGAITFVLSVVLFFAGRKKARSL